MEIRIDKRRKIPLYRQIMNQIIKQMDEGLLLKGDRLPSERALAIESGVNRSTIVRAYDELYAQGFVERKSSSGTYVLGTTKESFSGHHHGPLFFMKDKRLTKDPYVKKLDELIKRDNPRLINVYTGELPFDLVPNISLPSFHWKEFLQEEVSALGYLELRQTIQNLMIKTYEYQPKEDEIMLTAGGQQSLVLLMQSLLKPGDVVAIEDPSFFNGMSLFKSMSIKVIKIPVDANGLCVEELEKVLQTESIQMVLTNPNFQNPTGSSMSLKRRKKLVEICRTFRIPIIEDDVFGQLSYDVPHALPLLKELAPETVIYIGSLSKILGKRMQLGWIDAPSLVLNEVIKLRDEYESELSIFPQVLATHALKDETFLKQLADLRHQLKEKKDFLEEELTANLEMKLTCSFPDGGYYAWLTYEGRKLVREDWNLLLKHQMAVYPSFLNAENGQSCRINLARLTNSQTKMLVSRFKIICQLWETDSLND